MQKELFEGIISIVSDLTDISREEMLSRSRRSDVTEARCLLVYLLRSQGVKPYKIALLLGIPERCVYYSITSFSMRSDQDGCMLKAWYNDARSRLSKLCKSSDKSLP